MSLFTNTYWNEESKNLFDGWPLDEYPFQAQRYVRPTITTMWAVFYFHAQNITAPAAQSSQFLTFILCVLRASDWWGVTENVYQFLNKQPAFARRVWPWQGLSRLHHAIGNYINSIGFVLGPEPRVEIIKNETVDTIVPPEFDPVTWGINVTFYVNLLPSRVKKGGQKKNEEKWKNGRMGTGSWGRAVRNRPLLHNQMRGFLF